MIGTITTYIISGWLFFIGIVGYSQNTFQKTWGGVWDDIANDIAATSDGNFVVTGITYNSNLSCNNILLMKIDTMGDTLWTRVYGASGGQTGWRVIQTYDGGYAIAAHAAATNMHDNIMLIKTDENGNLSWYKMYGGVQADGYAEFLETPDSGYLFAADTRSFGFQPATCNDSDVNSCYSHIYLIKTDKNGDTLWTRVIYTNEGETPYSLLPLRDGNYIIAGVTWSFTTLTAAILIKIDANGNLLWSKAYKNKFTEARGVIEKEDGSLIIMGNGYWGNLIYTRGIVIAETDSAGNLKWVKITDDDTIPGQDYVMDIAYQNKNYWITFFPQRGVAGIEPIAGVMKLDTNLNILWQKVYGWGGGGLTKSTILSNGNTISATWANELGKGNKDVFIFSTDTDGSSACNTWDMNLTLLDIDTATIEVIDTGFVVGNTNTIVVNYPLQQGYPQLEMMDCDSFVGVPDLTVNSSKLTIFPNPSTGELNIVYSLSGNEKAEFSVYDIIGKKLLKYELPVDKTVYTISDLKLENGVYFYDVSVEREHVATGRIVVVK